MISLREYKPITGIKCIICSLKIQGTTCSSKQVFEPYSLHKESCQSAFGVGEVGYV